MDKTPHHREEPRATDIASLKGLGHPLRIEILDQLMLHGPATSAMLADRLGESTGSTSYHLRQLARHGFIEESEGSDNARERFWKPAPGGVTVSRADDLDNPAELRAVTEVTAQLLAQRARHLDRFSRDGFGEFGHDWMEASAVLSTNVTITREELAALGEEFVELILARRAALKGRALPDDARPVLIEFHAFPVVGAPERKARP